MKDLSFFSSKRPSSFLWFFTFLAIVFLIPSISLALFLSSLFTPVVQWCYTKTKIPYIFIVFGSVAISFFLLYLLIDYFIQSFRLFVPQLTIYFTDGLFQQPLLSELARSSLTFIEQLSDFAVTTVKNIFHYVFEVIIFMIVFFFSLVEGRRNPYWFFMYTPKAVRSAWQSYYMRAMQLFTTFLFVELRLFVLTFVLLAIGFFILDFTLPVQKALLIALADCFPFFGIGIILIPAALYFYITNNLLLCIAIVILYIFIQITRQLTESYLWAATFHIRTIHTFIISAASVLLFGFYGILLSPFLLLLAVKLRQHAIFAR